MKKERNGRVKLWVELPKELYERLQRCAEKRNISFTKYINRSLLRSVIEEEKHE